MMDKFWILSSDWSFNQMQVFCGAWVRVVLTCLDNKACKDRLGLYLLPPPWGQGEWSLMRWGCLVFIQFEKLGLSIPSKRCLVLYLHDENVILKASEKSEAEVVPTLRRMSYVEIYQRNDMKFSICTLGEVHKALSAYEQMSTWLTIIKQIIRNSNHHQP